MYLPNDLVFKILSYIEYDTIKNLNFQFKYYSEYLKSRFKTQISPKWIYGIYKNSNNVCFKCQKLLESKFIIVLCMNCEFNLDNYFSFPMTCVKCINFHKIKQNIMFISNCVNCKKKNTVHLITEKFY